MTNLIRSCWQYITGKGTEGTQKTGLFDPVCGLDVSDSPPLTSKFGKKTYYFCSNACAESFKAEPRKYVSG